jgi:hypothetical protein
LTAVFWQGLSGTTGGVRPAWPAAFAANLARSRRIQWGSKGRGGDHERASSTDQQEEAEPSATTAAAALDDGDADTDGQQPRGDQEAAAEQEQEGGVAGEWRRCCAALSRASLVVGMHPDQAAGAIVAFATVRGLPFALVPCCVYAKEFPRRKVRPAPAQLRAEQPHCQPATCRFCWLACRTYSRTRYYRTWSEECSC